MQGQTSGTEVYMFNLSRVLTVINIMDVWLVVCVQLRDVHKG